MAAARLAYRPARTTEYGLIRPAGPDPVLSSNRAFRAADGVTLPGLGGGAEPRCAGYPDPEVFFPVGADDSADLAEAVAVCATCPLREDCLQAAVAMRADGVWGGVLLERGRPVRLSAPAGRPPSPSAVAS